MTRSLAAALLVLGLVVTACGTAETLGTSDATPDTADLAAICLEGAADCDGTPTTGDLDTVADPEGVLDEGRILREAAALLGEPEDQVLEEWPDLRLGRRDGEALAVTDDHVVGRKTIATEDDGSGTHRVVEVTVELTDSVQVLPDA
jgi:hypothetical protein